MASPPSPSTRDLAAQLGLCHNTVARALRNAPNVAPATRKRVLEAAAAAGYRVNPLVTALMVEVRQRKRAHPSGEVLAFLTAQNEENGWEKLPSHVDQFHGARAKAAASGFDLQPMWLGDQASRSRQLSRIMKTRGVRGALLAPLATDFGDALQLDWPHMAIVTIGYSVQQMQIHRAAHDGIGIAATCYSRLHEAGFRRIGMAVPIRYSARDRHLFVDGFLGAQWWHRQTGIEPLLIADEADPSSFFRWMKKHRPDAVIGIWPDLPLKWLREKGLQVPTDVSYASLDLEGHSVGQVAGMMQNNRALGASAMDVLTGQLFRNEIGVPATPQVTLIKGTWTDGPTMAPRTK